MKNSLRFLLIVGVALGEVGPLRAQNNSEALDWTGPQLLSPGARGREGRVAAGCPTFSWAATPGAAGFVLEVYDVGATSAGWNPDQEPRLRIDFPAGASSWTPDLGECLPPGRYGWAVAATIGNGARAEHRWSKPAIFRVEGDSRGTFDEERRRDPLAASPDRPLDAAAIAPRPGAPTTAAFDAARFDPPACSGAQFTDVDGANPYCKWIEQLARDGIAAGCGGGKYCPANPVTREQLAMFLERAMRGTLDFAPAPGGPRITTILGGNPPAEFVFDVALAIGYDGLPVVAYHQNGHLWVMHCNDVACAGGDETISVVDDFTADDVGADLSIAIGTDHFPIISYTDSTTSALKAAHCNDGACAGHNETITTLEDIADLLVGSAIAIGGDGLPVIAYSDYTAGTLRVAHCAFATCAGGRTITTVDDPPTNFVGLGAAITIGTDLLPVISYGDSTDGAIKVLHCNVFYACSGTNTITTIDDSLTNTLIAAGGIRIGLPDFLPVISYYDSSAQALKVAHCSNQACTAATINTVDDPANDVGAESSLAIGSDLMPVIAYLDWTGGLKVAHCNDAACAGGNETITTVDDPPTQAGRSPSIAVGTDGVPVIAYHDFNLGTLKVIHCGTLSCTQ